MKIKKPLSEKQLAANRANAQKSRGPITHQGKINSRHASARHTVLTDTVLVDHESRQRFAKLVNALYAEFQPQTTAERIYVDKLAVAHWNTTRLWSLQSTAINMEMRERQKTHPQENVVELTTQAVRKLSEAGRSLDVFSLQMQRFDQQYNQAMYGLVRHRKENPPANPETLDLSHQPNENKEPGDTEHPILIPVDPKNMAVDPNLQPVDPII